MRSKRSLNLGWSANDVLRTGCMGGRLTRNPGGSSAVLLEDGEGYKLFNHRLPAAVCTMYVDESQRDKFISRNATLSAH